MHSRSLCTDGSVPRSSGSPSPAKWQDARPIWHRLKTIAIGRGDSGTHGPYEQSKPMGGASGTGTDKPMAEGSRVSVSERNGIGGKDGGSENAGQQLCHRYS